MRAAAVASEEDRDLGRYGFDDARRATCLHVFRQQGRSVRAWAIENGFDPRLAHLVVSGKRKALRGQSHRIAVAFGFKDAEAAND
jgi:gp16 family phage-associated protein